MAFSPAGEVHAAFTGKPEIDGVLSGYRWRHSEIFYSDPDHRNDFGPNYVWDQDRDGISVLDEYGFSQINDAQLASVHLAMNASYLPDRDASLGFSVSGFTELDLTYAGDGNGAAEIRVTNSSDFGGGYAWFPLDDDERGGDVWLSENVLWPRVGNDNHVTVLHELGHALGLKHGHEAVGGGKLPREVDSNEFSLMTYRVFVGGGTSIRDIGAYEEWSAPQGFMMIDIAALQHLYGANFGTNSGDTTYRWKPHAGTTWIDGEVGLKPGANRIFATIWDGGGEDTYNLSAYETDVSIDLRPGRWSVFSAEQLADLRGGPNNGFARGNIFNAWQYGDDPRSLIENAKGGAGDDRIRGNAADNLLQGKGGNDTLRGGPGADLLVGGRGRDVFDFNQSSESTTGMSDMLLAGNGAKAFRRPGDDPGDLIDVSDIDARWGEPGDQSFRFGEEQGKGRLWVENRDGNTLVLGNTDGDSRAEFRLVIADGPVKAETYSAADFIL